MTGIRLDAEKLKSLRRGLFPSQDAMCQGASFDKRTLRRGEGGHSISLRKAEAIAERLGVKLSDLKAKEGTTRARERAGEQGEPLFYVSGLVPGEFLREQTSLKIKFKDGYSFFASDSRYEILRARLGDPRLRTTVLILHPDSPWIDAVASMDPEKAKSPARQRNDCLQAIATMQRLEREHSDRAAFRSRIRFLGYPFIPTWTGFIGDSVAYVHRYYTRPYRGSLVTHKFRRPRAQSADNSYFDAMEYDFDEVVRLVTSEGEKSLFDYALPADIHAIPALPAAAEPG